MPRPAQGNCTQFHGRWVQVSDGKAVAEIENGVLQWLVSDDYNKQDEKVTVNAKGELVLTLEGVTLTGRLIDEKIVWSDGDEWYRDAKSDDPIAKFNGCWMQDKPVAQIENGILKWRLGDDYQKHEERVTVNDKGELVLDIEGVSSIGRLVNDEIVWSDGDTWCRDVKADRIVQYDGIWAEDDEPVAEVRDASLMWLVDGLLGEEVSEMKVLDSGKIEMDMDGESFTGEIIDGALVWSDGKKWTKIMLPEFEEREVDKENWELMGKKQESSDKWEYYLYCAAIVLFLALHIPLVMVVQKKGWQLQMR